MTRIKAASSPTAHLVRRRPRPALLATATIAAMVVATALSGATANAAPAATAVMAASAAPASLLSAAAPAGKLGAQGCTATPGIAACDLFAMAGTAPILGTPIPIWGFSTTGAAGSATAPGPVLVVHQDDVVTITLHNQLVGEDVSLALPGQSAAAFSGGSGDDMSGVGAGATRIYSFTATRPGTFLYEAGHTHNGGRQVAMGLAGALIVLPADGTAYGTASTGYNDDAVLVMSEIDPALNANPATFDMRNFAPKYRMFNGKPYPTADPISTDQGHKVLLRYVNAGSQTHAMSVLGGDQVEIAQDGHAMQYASTVTAESVAPGQTLDTVVTMPTGPEAKLAVYEPAMHLDNNGQHTNDPLQFAFGGLLTFLDTAAPPPSTDGVGPVSSHITVSPNPSDGLGAVTVTADLSDATTGHSSVTQAEFAVDDAVTTGAGFGIPMSGAFGSATPPFVENVVGAQGTIPAVAPTCIPLPGAAPPVALNCLDAGKHTVFVRALDSAGNWGVIGSVVLNLPKTGPQTTGGTLTASPANGTVAVGVSATGDDSAAGGSITNAEYFIDTVGTNGLGTGMTLNRSATVVSEDASIPAAVVLGLSEGTHDVLVHSKNMLGLWGPTLDIPLVVDKTGPGVEAAAVGPNPSNGILTDRSNPGYLVVSARITDRDAGNAIQSKLVSAEAFLEPKTVNPAGGTGLQLIAVDGSIDSTSEAVYGLFPISQVRALGNGDHHVYVRGQDAAGNWGPLFGINLVVDKVAPVLAGTLTGSPNPTNGAANLSLSAAVTETVGLGAAEFWLGATDPGVGKGTRVSVGVTGGNAVATVPLAAIPPGVQRFNLRVQDTAGNWSNALNTSVTVSRPNGIFNGFFEAGTPGWSGSTGSAVTNVAAKMVSVVEPASTKGLVVTIPTTGNANAKRSFVTDSSPAAETSYHASFMFNANSLASGTASGSNLTIFDGQTAGGGGIFALQFHRTGGPTPVNQVWVIMTRSGGTTTGTAVTLPGGSHLIQLDWLAGPATGAAAGSLVLKVDGAQVSALTGNSSNLRLEAVRLGVTAGVTNGTNASTGSAWFDGFTSTRYTLP